MKIFWTLLLLATVTVIHCEEGEEEGAYVTPLEMKVIQEKMDKLHVMEETIMSIFSPKSEVEEREDECLPLGSECSFTSGPRCCSIRARCFIWDRLENIDKRGRKSKWVSHCKEYNAGRWVDDIGNFFKSLG